MFSGEVASGFPLRLAAIFPFSYAAETSSSESEGSFSSNSLPRSVSMIFALLGWLVPTRIAKRERGVMRKATTLIIEPLSLDEAYLDVTENLKAHPVCRAAARKITCLPRAYASRSPDGPKPAVQAAAWIPPSQTKGFNAGTAPPARASARRLAERRFPRLWRWYPPLRRYCLRRECARTSRALPQPL